MHRNVVVRSGAVLLVVATVLAACSGSESTDPPADASVDDSAAATPTDGGDEPTADESASTDNDDGEATPASPTTVPRGTFAAVSVDPDTGEVTEYEQEVPGPNTYAQVVDAGVEAGIWDELDGLTRVLDYAVGALPAEQVPGVEEVLSGELTEVLGRAWRLDASGEYDADELGPLRRRYVMFSPPEDILDDLATGATEVPALRGFRSVAASPACVPIAVDEFDDNSWIEGCYQVVQTTVPGATLRVFYPIWYEVDGGLATLPTLALDALIRSVDTYRTLGRVGDIDVVFSAVDTIDNAKKDGNLNALASAGGIRPWGTDVTDRCAVTIWPVATADPTSFEQTIAHEAWHCVQYYDGMDYSGGLQNWWVEGGAEFFSNVVYPAANDEHAWIDTFDGELMTPLPEMAYEVWLWWQYLSNENSPLFVADLHRTMMARGGSGIELFGGYDETLHDFVADYVAGTVIDQSGVAIRRTRRFVDAPPVMKGQEGREVTWTAPSWAPVRFHIPYDKQLRILQSDESSGGLRSMVKWGNRSDRSAWKAVFPEIRSTCTDRARYVGVITDANSEAASNSVDLTIVIDEIEEAACDPCVLGTWSLDLDTFEEQILAAMPSEGGVPPEATFELGGADYIAFDDENQTLEQRDGFTVTATIAGQGSVTFTIDSFAVGTYSADGEQLAVNELVDTYSRVTTDLPVPGTFNFPGGISEGSGAYTCDADRLVVTVEAYPPVSFARVDKILTPADAPAANPDD